MRNYIVQSCKSKIAIFAKNYLAYDWVFFAKSPHALSPGEKLPREV